ncbi:MAG TPA: sulfurtransferase [Conexibacter sp.]|nr:sulfurtransferase [Conexibacter sp.]
MDVARPASGSSSAARPLAPADPAAVLVDAHALAAQLAAGDRPVLLDLRWRLGDDTGPERCAAGHLPGAVYVDLDRELAAPPSPREGRHPLPPLEELQAAARRWGVSQASRVVVYDDSRGLSAARAWWLLRWAGVADVRLLDGGLEAWQAAGLPLETGAPPDPLPGDVVLRADPDALLSADEAAALARRGGTLLDVRAAERYTGETEPVDPRAGHVPGARSAPTTANLREDGTFLAPQELRRRFAALGVEPGADVGVYCGSGVNAAHAIAALALAGIPARLYAGSWSQWSSDPARPVAVGPDPG